VSPKTKYVLATVGACLLAASGRAHAQDATPHSAAPAEHAWSAGGKIFDKWCGDCHSTAGGPGSLALQRKYRDDLPAVLEQRSDLAPDYVRQVVRHGISFMPSFRKTEISDADLALLAAYLAPRRDGHIE
jgi:mono/diheme cytochrome c family protein